MLQSWYAESALRAGSTNGAVNGCLVSGGRRLRRNERPRRQAHVRAPAASAAGAPRLPPLRPRQPPQGRGDCGPSNVRDPQRFTRRARPLRRGGDRRRGRPNRARAATGSSVAGADSASGPCAFPPWQGPAPPDQSADRAHRQRLLAALAPLGQVALEALEFLVGARKFTTESATTLHPLRFARRDRSGPRSTFVPGPCNFHARSRIRDDLRAGPDGDVGTGPGREFFYGPVYWKM